MTMIVLPNGLRRELQPTEERYHQEPQGRTRQIASYEAAGIDKDALRESLCFDETGELFLKFGRKWIAMSVADSVAWFSTCDQRDYIGLGELVQEEQAKLDWLRAVESELRGIRES